MLRAGEEKRGETARKVSSTAPSSNGMKKSLDDTEDKSRVSPDGLQNVGCSEDGVTIFQCQSHNIQYSITNDI